MTYLELTKLLGQTDLFICLMAELGYEGTEIADKLQISEPTVYNAKNRLKVLTDNVTTASELKPDLRNKDIETVVNAFKEAFGTTTITRWDRYAAKRLADRHGSEGILKVINALALSSGEEFCPSVNNVRELEKKWVSVLKFIKKKVDTSKVIEL